MGSEDEYHKVEQGETTTGLAFDRGLDWKTVWQHPNNLQLRTDRKDPNILHPGDVLFLPQLQVKEFLKPTDQLHSFVLTGLKEKFNMQFLDAEGKPYSGEPYLLTVDRRPFKGKLDDQGWVRVSIPANSQTGHILVGNDGIVASCDLHFGYLDPLTEITGIQARLSNLGYFDGEIDGADSDQSGGRRPAIP